MYYPKCIIFLPQTSQYLNVLKLQPMLNSGQQDKKLFDDKSEIYSMRVAQIQKQLNLLCCQHDSLMPLLELNTYENCLSKWDNSLKSINKKIVQYEVKMEQLLAEGSKQMNEEVNAENSKHREIYSVKMNIEKLKQNMEGLKPQKKAGKGHQLVAELIHSLYQQNNQRPNYSDNNPNNFNKFRAESQECLKQLRKDTELSLALFKNQLMLNEMSESHRLANSRNLSQLAQGKETILQKIQETMFGSLKRELQTLRCGLQQYDLKDFHIQTFARLSSQLAETNQILELLYLQNTQVYTHANLKAKLEELEILEEKIKLIGWQIKGLRKKYVCKLNHLYLQQAKAQETKSMEKMLANDVSTLHQAFTKVRDKLSYFKNDIQAKL